MAAGAALVFLTAVKELPTTLLLSPTGFPTLATGVWSAVSEAFFARAAAPALLLILLSAVPMALLNLHASKGKR
jgi:iron(III) transport system permease protein